jgi:hypothetical protein
MPRGSSVTLKSVLLGGLALVGLIFVWEDRAAPTKGSDRARSVAAVGAAKNFQASPPVTPIEAVVVDRYPIFPPPVQESRTESSRVGPSVSPWNERSWAPKASTIVMKAPVPLAPLQVRQTSAPILPKIPFEFLGAMNSPTGGSIIFLKLGDEQLALQLGDLVAQHWRLEGLGVDRVNFRHLPTNIETFLARGHVTE